MSASVHICHKRPPARSYTRPIVAVIKRSWDAAHLSVAGRGAWPPVAVQSAGGIGHADGERGGDLRLSSCRGDSGAGTGADSGRHERQPGAGAGYRQRGNSGSAAVTGGGRAGVSKRITAAAAESAGVTAVAEPAGQCAAGGTSAGAHRPDPRPQSDAGTDD